jgi:hypothetical protein
MKRIGNGRNGWMMLVAGVAVWDILFDDTLSEAFGRAAHGKGGPAVVAVWTVLTAHLFDVIPPCLDPFHLFLKNAKQLGRVGTGRRLAR